MQKRIHHLDSLTIDKIAAGEVIDVPASCVKELVENALDAGADDILIEVQLGGRELIRVKDSGCGMCREDVIASIERHATSKIICVEDLEKISSMGFRGEALASIVAIAKVRITSAERIGEASLSEGTSLLVEGGEVKSVTTTKALPGTTVEVRDLFYNVPARRKFLKTPAKDTQDIIKAVTCLALSFPDVTFRLVVDGKEVVTAHKATSHIARAKALLKEPFQNSFEIDHRQEGFSLYGLVAEPGLAKTNRTGQYLFVNGRSVFSLPVSYAVKSGFGTSCEQNKHPQFVLHLTLDPASIDINVHPQKKEIRFADEEWVRTLVQEKVSEALWGKRTFSFRKSDELQAIEEWNPLPQNLQEESPELFSFQEVAAAPLQEPFQEILAVLGEIALIRSKDSYDSLFLLDLKRAMKAVLFKELMASSPTKTHETLLIPVALDCSQDEASHLLSLLPEFENQGFLIRPFGATSFLVEAIPQALQTVDVQKVILEALHAPDLFFEKNKELRAKRLASLYVSLMKSLVSPITAETAYGVYKAYQEKGSPKICPDGNLCTTTLRDVDLKRFF